jgi:hypothetical protein
MIQFMPKKMPEINFSKLIRSVKPILNDGEFVFVLLVMLLISI